MSKQISCINYLIKHVEDKEVLKEYIIKLCTNLNWTSEEIEAYLELHYGQKYINDNHNDTYQLTTNFCSKLKEEIGISDHCLICPDSPEFKNTYESEEKLLLSYAIKSKKNITKLLNLGLCENHFKSVINLNYSTDNVKLLLIPACKILYSILEGKKEDHVRAISKALSQYDLTDSEQTLFYCFYDDISNKKEGPSNESLGIALMNIFDSNSCSYNDNKVKKAFNLKQQLSPNKEHMSGQVTIDNILVASEKNVDSNPLQALLSDSKEVGDSLLESLTINDTSIEKKQVNHTDITISKKEQEYQKDPFGESIIPNESIVNEEIDKENSLSSVDDISDDVTLSDKSKSDPTVTRVPVDVTPMDYNICESIEHLSGYKKLDVFLFSHKQLYIEYDRTINSFIIYLKGTYYTIDLANETIMSEFVYYILDKNYVKISFFPHELIGILLEYQIKISNVFSLFTAYSVLNYNNAYKTPLNIIKEITGKTIEDSNVIALMEYYPSIYKYFKKHLTLDLRYRLDKELSFDYLLGYSFFYNRLFNVKDFSFNPQDHFTYAYLYNDNLILKDKGIILKAKYENIPKDNNNLILGYHLKDTNRIIQYLYRSICIDLVNKHAIDKYSIMLLQLNSDCLIFHSTNNCYSVLFDILNRLMIETYQKYYTKTTPNIIIQLN